MPDGFSPSEESTVLLPPRAGFIRSVIKRGKLPLNEYGLPEGIYRPDLLPSDPYAAATSVASTDAGSEEAAPPPSEGDTLKASLEPTSLAVHGQQATDILLADTRIRVAYVPLNHQEGFTSLPDGRPFWYRQDFEPVEAFAAFEVYLAQGREGVHQLFLLQEELDPGTKKALESVNLSELYHLYYWGWRAKAFDLFDSALRRRQRAIRAADMEDYHYLLSERMLNMGIAFLQTDEFRDNLSPKVALDMIKQAMAGQRVSSGLPVNGPTGREDVEVVASLEVHMQQAAKERGEGGQVIDQDGINIEDMDEEDAERVQSIILKAQLGVRT